MSKLSKLWRRLRSRADTLRASGAGFALSLLFATSAALTPLQADAAGKLRVETKEGPVKGFLNNGVAEFLGIPYAAPPIGNLRWRPPQKHERWTNVLHATAYGPSCAQIYELGLFAGPANNNEDCLYINVFTPDVDPAGKEKLPVMFWSYGGAAVDGESNDYDGSKLARDGHTVVVTFNYRQNLFGFLAHPALDHEGHLFANYGILDNQFALKWVKRNIEKFGGDPNNVTVFGQSAGARNTGSEVLSPLAKGLFNRAIFESGAIPIETPLSIAEAKGTAFAVAAGCGSLSDAATAKCLRSLSAARVESFAGTTTSSNGAYLAGLITDGQILPLPAIDQYLSGNFNHVPIINGNAENEGNFFIVLTEYFESPRAPLTEAQFVAYVNSVYSGNAGPGGSPPAYPPGTVAAVLAQYPLSAYPSPQLQWGALETDANYSCISRHMDQILASQVPLYTYEFRDQTAPFYYPPMPGFASLAYHTSDIQYYWPLYHGGQGTPHPLNSKQEELSDQLVTAWTNFAWTGNPNGQGNKPWPRYKAPNGLFLAEDIKPAGLSTFTADQFSAEHHCDFWDKLLVYKSTTP
ncbi:carboxylesterase/lipase family protein [Methylocella tundrae]|uniref:Carboxylic ester hydrolase n=1 Tax=Methylocella tundrae TaxID=227605 RepID=A0A4U8Z4Y2_METTU|nr:carboxylesterase family protein [Methylocella tundrae]WPP04230.1 carboxylesterase family protein [Methylocella tundrae]VFU10535.1 Carboxylic ester hydrolase [Methylocella tundrae]